MVHILYSHLVNHTLQMTPQVKIKLPPRSARGLETSVATHTIAATNPMTWKLPIYPTEYADTYKDLNHPVE